MKTDESPNTTALENVTLDQKLVALIQKVKEISETQ